MLEKSLASVAEAKAKVVKAKADLEAYRAGHYQRRDRTAVLLCILRKMTGAKIMMRSDAYYKDCRGERENPSRNLPSSNQYYWRWQEYGAPEIPESQRAQVAKVAVAANSAWIAYIAGLFEAEAVVSDAEKNLESAKERMATELGLSLAR